MSVGEDVTFNYMDMYNAFKKSDVEKCLDSTGLVQFLQEKEETKDFKWGLRHDKEGLLSILVFEVDGGRSIH